MKQTFEEDDTVELIPSSTGHRVRKNGIDFTGAYGFVLEVVTVPRKSRPKVGHHQWVKVLIRERRITMPGDHFKLIRRQ